MSKLAHSLYIAILSLIVLSALVFLIVDGYSYYQQSLEERFFHPDHTTLKPSGAMGHGLGIIGSLLIIIGVSIYMARKRFRSWGRMGYLKHWLEFHIFLCTLGPIMILFHTSFKFGGLVAISFWSMVAVFLSGIIGRFIYIQIPRTIEGRELGLNEIREMKDGLSTELRASLQLSEEDHQKVMAAVNTAAAKTEDKDRTGFFQGIWQQRRTVKQVKKVLKENNIPPEKQRNILRLVRADIALSRRISRLQMMQNLFKYWHVAHLPFAFVMLIIMLVHVAVTIIFGYRWIF